MRDNGGGEMVDDADRRGDADRGPSEMDEQPRSAEKEQDRELVEFLLRHADSGVALNHVRLVAEFPGRRKRKERG